MKVLTFGCRLNAFESAVIRQAADDLDIILVNTCAVTGEAERQCRQAIRKAHREHPNTPIVVAGCAVQLHPELYAAMPEVSRVLGNREKLSRALLERSESAVGAVGDEPFDLPVISDFEGRARAFLQVQQGCDHRCTFCIVPLVRGRNAGLPVAKIIGQARAFVEKGFAELVLTGVDITSYPGGLVPMVRRLLEAVPEIRRLRFGSLDPACLDADFVRLMREFPQVMPYLHLSMQSGDDVILKRMGRRHTREQVLDFIGRVRAARPEATFGADIIAGFPTETERQFDQTMDFVRRGNITHLHVFPYSARAGTPAAKMPPVPVPVRKERARRLRELGQKLHDDLLISCVGAKISVLMEQDGRGWSDTYLKVRAPHAGKPGQVADVVIRRVEGHELVG
ncbi:MAG: tRNA (N(6)-L-threonylcarbamoyladenosine(37)-C(2))-methylthiotransferase MtaB [Alphaproteobacteria bacterium]|nr:tRNA (N(6)-L-threonylcarbamoyladenosine(37)-C(2))-methylthiotransferase MtaB [Alphaproteobacteria bacterium]